MTVSEVRPGADSRDRTAARGPRRGAPPTGPGGNRAGPSSGAAGACRSGRPRGATPPAPAWSTSRPETRQELVTAVADRYRQSTAAEKRLVLDEFVALTGYHRKHAVRVLNGSAITPRARRGRRCVYDAAVTHGVDRSVGGVGPDVRQAAEGAAPDPGAGARASRPLVAGPGGARAALGGECCDDRPPPGVRAGRDGRSTPAPALRAERVAGQRAEYVRSAIGRTRLRVSSRQISSRTAARRCPAVSSGRWC